MNYKMVSYIVMQIVRLLGLFMMLPCLFGIIYKEYKIALFYFAFAICYFLVGLLGTRLKPKNTCIYQKEGFIAVALCWITISLLGSIPFVVTREIPNYVDALFEMVSGFTTTGASIIPNVEIISHASLFWRSFSHWIGGMGVLVFALMILPARDGTNINLMRAESPGPDVSKIVPKVRNMAIILYKIYIFITLCEIAILLITGMPFFDTVCISMGTAGTGGFAVLNSGCATYTPLQQWIITIFMILFGINFTFYYYLMCKKVGMALKMEEVKIYLLIIVASVAFITANIYSIYGSIGEALRHASFQVGSIITTTGFSTSNFDLWPELSKTILVGLMFVGACAGSTGGGLKVSRIIILFRNVKRDIYRTIHPRRVKTVQMDGKTLMDDQRHTVSVYLAAFLLVYVISWVIISIDGFSLETNFTAVAATINNVGPGLDLVGPASNFASYGAVSKIVLAFDMLAGRLEIFPMLLLLSPSAYRSKN